MDVTASHTIKEKSDIRQANESKVKSIFFHSYNSKQRLKLVIVTLELKKERSCCLNKIKAYIFKICLEALNTNNHTFEVAPVFILVEQAIIKYLMQLLSWDTEV